MERSVVRQIDPVDPDSGLSPQAARGGRALRESRCCLLEAITVWPPTPPRTHRSSFGQPVLLVARVGLPRGIYRGKSTPASGTLVVACSISMGNGASASATTSPASSRANRGHALDAGVSQPPGRRPSARACDWRAPARGPRRVTRTRQHRVPVRGASRGVGPPTTRQGRTLPDLRRPGP